MSENTVRVRWQPKQRIAWNLWDGPLIRRLGIGGARGGSKSGFIRRGSLLRRFKYAGSAGLILRRTLPELERSHLLKLFREYPQLRPYYNEQKKMLSLPNGSVQVFASAPTAKDMADFYSAEFADICVDEAQEFSQDELERLTGSNRCTDNPAIVCKMVFAFMPGMSESGVPPIGLPYLKRVFVDKDLRGEERNVRWDFVQAFAWDNIEWARPLLELEGFSESDWRGWTEEERKSYFKRTEFGAQLLSLTNAGLREAWLEGKWDVFEGQYFGCFEYDTHTVDSQEVDDWLAELSRLRVQPTWWLSYDWGDYHPNSMYLHAMDHTGKIVTVAEEWVRQVSEAEMAHRAIAMCDRFHCRPESFLMSWDAFGKLSKRTRQPITKLVTDALPEDFPRPFPTDSTPGSRIARARFMKKCLEEQRWFISRECVKLIECIPNLVRDMERNPEDVLKVDWSETSLGDDPYDAASYGLQYKSGFTPQVPKPEPPAATGPYMAFKLSEFIESQDHKSDPTVATYISSRPRRTRKWR